MTAIQNEINSDRLVFIAKYIEKVRKEHPAALPLDVQDEFDNFVATVKLENPTLFR